MMDCESSSGSGKGQLQYFIHPLAITFICDHFTRMRLGGSHLPKDSPVIGLLFGTMDGSVVEVADATEAIYTMQSDNTAVLNIAEIETKRQLWLEVYKDYQLLGWYSVGAVLEHHMAIHQSIRAGLSGLDCPLFLLMDVSEAASAARSDIAGSKRLPIMLFNSESVGGSSSVSSPQIFVSLEYRILSSSYENFTVDAIVKSTPLGAGVSAFEASNHTMGTALGALGTKVDTIVACLQACKGASPELKSSVEYQSFLRLAQRIVAQLPAPAEEEVAAAATAPTEVAATNVSRR
jgi:hypothetical protein